MERELPRILPDGVTMHCNRLSRPNPTLTVDSLLAMKASIPRAVRDLMQMEPEVIIYGCTSGSFLGPDGSEEKIASEIEALSGVPAITTAQAVCMALHEMKATTVYMITPYPEALNIEEARFLEERGIRVPSWDAFPCTTSKEIRQLTSDDVAELVLSHQKEIQACDAVFISCTQLVSVDRIDSMEEALRKPVISSNQASLWAALRHMEIDMRDSRCGQLLRTLAFDTP